MANTNTQYAKSKQSTISKTISSYEGERMVNSLEPVQRDLSWLKKYVSNVVFVMINRNSEDVNVQKDVREKTQLLNLELLPDPITDSPYDKFIKENGISLAERLIISTAIAPYFSAGLLSVLNYEDSTTKKPYPDFGGVTLWEKDFLPTIDTMRFLITLGDIIGIQYVDKFFKDSGRLMKHNVISLYNHNGNIYWNKQVVQPTEEFLALIKNQEYEPTFNSNFPASKIGTKLDWNDLVLPYDTMKELKEISIWLKHRNAIMEHPHLGRIIKPGFRSLFYGPPGTGKTLTASLLGKITGLDVYRIDLSMVVSKWVGETEKNLKGIFDQAQNKNWILFFDEADSLFGKRTQNKSSNDRHANQEVAYLLQRIEDFPGLVLLATNLKDNIDEAFARRFQSMVNFPIPDAETRLTLWQNSIPKDFLLESTVNLEQFADEHEVAGGIIINVIRYCALMAMARGDKIFTEEDLENGIARELRKSGKIVG
jgi:adenylate kinase family enzyme